jgi:hypothetical protein
MKKLLTALGVAALLTAGCASQDKDNGMGGTSDTDINMSGTTSQGTTSQDTLKTDSINSNGNGGSQNANGNTGGAAAAPNTSTPSSTPPQ